MIVQRVPGHVLSEDVITGKSQRHASEVDVPPVGNRRSRYRSRHRFCGLFSNIHASSLPVVGITRREIPVSAVKSDYPIHSAHAPRARPSSRERAKTRCTEGGSSTTDYYIITPYRLGL